MEWASWNLSHEIYSFRSDKQAETQRTTYAWCSCLKENLGIIQDAYISNEFELRTKSLKELDTIQ